MGIIYSPLLLVTAYLETSSAHRVIRNRARDESDDDTVEEWEQLGESGDGENYETDGWAKKVEESKPNVETDAAVLEVRELRAQVKELVGMVKGLVEDV